MKILQKIKSARTRTGTSSRRQESSWFRGHRLNTWPLLPRILRHGHKWDYICRVENDLFASFRTNAQNFIELPSTAQAWDYLGAMQHYGIATRLLDWTTSLDIALYFALSGTRGVVPNDQATWPAIWVLNPYRLNRQFIGEDILFDKQDAIPFDYYAQTVSAIRDQRPWPHITPIALDTGYSNNRIRAQSGKFTLHGSDLRALEIQQKDLPDFWHLEKVLIDPNDLGELKDHFARRVDSHFQVFPDIQGFAMSLNARARV